jgi:TRAP transporter TAXI family solute receptor
MCFADVVYTGFVGKLDGTMGPLHKLRGIAVLQLTPMHLVVSARSGIRTVEDLRGRRVAVGRAGSGTAVTAGLVLNAVGIGPESVHIEPLGFNEAAERLVLGTLDALFVGGSDPLESVDLATRAGSRLLPLRGRFLNRLLKEHPFLSDAVVAGGTYPGYPDPVRTIGVDTVLISSSNLDESVVYALTRSLFEALPAIAAAQPSLRSMDLEQAPATPIPLHEGAARYYRERELSQ